jgi:hypothetical protein
VNERDELVRFEVPPLRPISDRQNRFWSSLELPAIGDSRAAPEYANIRQEVVESQGVIKVVDLNLASEAEFDRKLQNGGYIAAHLVDTTCDGAVAVEPIAGIDLPSHCAYSLVTAIDYFPQVDQMEIEEWIEARQGRRPGLSDPRQQFPQGGPQPMSDGRFQWNPATGDLMATHQLPNCTLPHPSNEREMAFSLADSANYTATAVVGTAATSGCVSAVPNRRRPPSWLPDGASDEFAPGWDVSQHKLNRQNMYAAYGLGSPFPEDAKLCAALNSYWPAVAPDAARTYGFRPSTPFGSGRALSTSIPLLDGELGYHREHPRVRAGEVAESIGWDGDFGPFLIAVDGQRFVDASNPLRADQSRAALDSRVGFSGLELVTTNQFIERMEALGWCRRKFQKEFDVSSSWLVTCEFVKDWSDWTSRLVPRADKKLTGEGLIFIFALVQTPGRDHGSPPLRRRFQVVNTLEIHLAELAGFSKLEILRDENEKPIAFFRMNAEPFQQLQ